MERRKLFSVTLADCRVECLASTRGAGGQNRNRRHTAVRITHGPSGAVGFSADERTQFRNKVTALTRLALTPAFGTWVRMEAARRQGRPSVEEQVERMLDPENIRVEVIRDGRWVQADLVDPQPEES